MITIRREENRDRQSVRLIYKAAFGQPTEADLVDTLRKSCPDRLALVAEEGKEVVGHILFTPASITTDDGNKISGMGLAPVAVPPDLQGEGIGSRLVNEGLAILKSRQYPFVIVLGYPLYYPRFGFVPAERYNIRCQWPDVPSEAFMVRILDKEVMSGISGGTAYYRDEFNQAV
ncbi:MAG: N-acetyltransferase [Proteobacteria bacterium]|nr:N-acetyltransferase [Pseudomonadota bacterium]MBU1688259.1 N-acetyltransferase [Pseudomonadota bacterium]